MTVLISGFKYLTVRGVLIGPLRPDRSGWLTAEFEASCPNSSGDTYGEQDVQGFFRDDGLCIDVIGGCAEFWSEEKKHYSLIAEENQQKVDLFDLSKAAKLSGLAPHHLVKLARSGTHFVAFRECPDELSNGADPGKYKRWLFEAGSFNRFRNDVLVADPNYEPPFTDKPTVTKASLLDDAKAAVADRGLNYGKPEDNFARIARLWSAHLYNTGKIEDEVQELTAIDVALMMDLMKTARLENDPLHQDSWVDKAGYAACGGEIAGGIAKDA